MIRLQVAWLLLAATVALGQPKLTLTMDRTILGVGEAVNMVLTLSGSSDASEVQLPPMQNLQVVAGPYTSTNYEFINGRASSSVSWTYQVRARQVGREEIGPLKVEVGGKIVTSNQIVVNVVKGATTGSAQRTSGDQESPDVFIRVVPDKTEAFQGEQITLTYKIYFAAQISQPEIVKSPSATGFWIEELSVPQQQALTDELVNGRAYKVGILRKVALFPTTTGELTVDPMTIATKVQRDARRRSRDPLDFFNDPFFSLGPQLEPVQVESPAVTLHAKPLPSTGVPEGFNGAVGVFKIRAYLDKTEAKTNEAVTFTIQIEGIGNIKTLPEPRLVLPPDLEHYDPKASDLIRREQQRIGGVKRFDYVIIPRAPGTQTIPPISYAFFDPSTNKYSTVSTLPLSLSVEKGTGTSSTAGIPVVTKRGVESIATDIAYIKTRSDAFVPRGVVPHEAFPFWLWTAGPWIALAGLIVLSRRREEAAHSQRSLARAMKSARTELVQAEKLLKAGNLDAASHRVSKCLNHIATGLLGDTFAGLLDPELKTHWNAQGFEEDLYEQLVKIERQCDLIRFAPAIADKAALLELLKLAHTVIDEAGKVRR